MFRSAQEAELSYESKRSRSTTSRSTAGVTRRARLTTVGRIIFNERIQRALEETLGDEYDRTTYEFVNNPLRKRDMNPVIERLVEIHGPYATALVLDAFKELGFHFASRPASRSRRTTS